MNKYTELSDFEINKKVAASCKLNVVIFEHTKIVIFDDMNATPFDPCNNPTDAMPIIIENKIGLSPMYHSNKWTADCLDYDFISVNKNPYRAAMEVYLLMKDAKNENNNNG